MKAKPGLERVIDFSAFVEGLFDRVSDVVFFVKDLDGRYRVVNQTLVERLGARTKSDLLGRTAQEVFPSPLGIRFLEQDLAVCRTGTPVTNQLELHLYSTRREGWCLTDKVPLRVEGEVVGLAGISRDLQPTGDKAPDIAEIATVLEHTRTALGTPV